MNTTNISFSGTIPLYYDANLGPMFFEPFATEMAQHIRGSKPSSILELACGTGRLTKYLPLALGNKSAVITATDVNPAMLDHAKRTVTWKNIDWQVVDAMDLPYGDDLFDIVAAQFGVMFYPDKRTAYKEAHRVLTPGGRFIFSAWDSLRHNPMAQLTSNLITEFFPVDTPGFYQIPFAYHNDDEIRADLMASGFRTVNIDIVKLEGYAGTALDAANGLLRGTPISTVITEHDEKLLPLMVEKLAEEIRSLFGDKDLSVPLQSRIVTAEK